VQPNVLTYLLALLTIIVMFLLLVSAGSVNGHEWYNPACCSERDCAPVPLETVRVTAEGWLVTVPAGVHPHAEEDIMELIPFGDDRVMMSQDANYHVCALLKGTILCFYVPAMTG